MSGDELAELYTLESIEQMRAISDPLRLRIVHLLARQPMTVTQVGAELGSAVGKAHYHVRELERVGLVRLVETREKGGVLEKYYRTVARDFTVPPSLLQDLPDEQRVAARASAAQAIIHEFLAAMQATQRRGDHEHEGRDTTILQEGRIWVTPDELHELFRQIADLMKPYTDPRPTVAGAAEHSILFAAYATPLKPASTAAEPVEQQDEEPPR